MYLELFRVVWSRVTLGQAVKAAEEKRIADEKKFQAAAEKKETRRVGIRSLAALSLGLQADELLKQYQKEYHEPGKTRDKDIE